MVAEKDKEECKKFADIFMSLPEDSKNMVIIYLSALRDREEADKARLQKTAQLRIIQMIKAMKILLKISMGIRRFRMIKTSM